MNKFQKYAKVFVTTVVDIMEEKPNIIFPAFFHYCVVVVCFLQISGFVFSPYESK